MVKSLAPAKASRACSPELAGVDPSHIGPLQLQELFHKEVWSAVAISPAEVQLPKGNWGVSDLSSLIDTSASMSGTLQTEGVQESVDKLASDF
jgi:hypothetical protein